MNVGQSFKRVDAFEKVTGRAKYVADMADRTAFIAKVYHAEIAHGKVRSFDLSEAEKMDGVIKIVTCFDIPKNYFNTAGHPYSIDPDHLDVTDRLILNEHIRYYGDDIAVVVARDEVTAKRALKAIKVEYEVYPFVLDSVEAMADGAPQIQENYPGNVLAHSHLVGGDFEAAIKEPGLLCVDKWYETPIVQHSHIENHGCYAYMEKGRVVVVSSTQIPHIVQRIVGQALGCPWGQVRVIKPYVGGGFGGKQDALYEPLCAYLTTQVGGRTVHIEMTREETYTMNRVRHAFKFHLTTWFRKDGTFVARKMESYSQQGSYASHGHVIASKGAGAFEQIYGASAHQVDAYTVFTNTASAGAMRGYGMPQFTFATECHVDDIAAVLHMDPVEIRRKNMMDVGFKDDFSGNVNYFPSHEQCMQKAMAYIGWDDKRKLYAEQTGPVRRGIGMSIFWYNTGGYPFVLELSSCRMVLNQDGTIQVQVGETEIGQGADTAFSQMAADAVGVAMADIHVVSTQDTDITPFGFGAYASRQTYMAGKAIWKAGRMFRDKLLDYAAFMLKCPIESLNIVDGRIIDVKTKEILLTMQELAVTAFYNPDRAEQITAECTNQCKENAYSFGCCFAEVEVDIPLCKVKVLDMINVHDCGRLINPALAKAQVHGGMSMAIGFGLSEQLIYDPATGRPVNGNLLDYKISTTMDHPHLEAQFVENPEPTHPFGTKALGEPPVCPGAAALRNAIYNATGVAFDAAPVNAQKMFEKFSEAGLFEEVGSHV